MFTITIKSGEKTDFTVSKYPHEIEYIGVSQSANKILGRRCMIKLCLYHTQKNMKENIMIELTDMLKELSDNELNLDQGNDLIAEMGMDSIQIIQLVVLIEQKYNIQIMDEDMDIDKLSKLDLVAEMIVNYLGTK